VRTLKPTTILEIGSGNKTVSNYLKQHGFDVTTCDFDKDLAPDYVADIRKLPFENDSYDLVLACEVLEHLPWNEVYKALEELHRVTKKYIVISIPYSAISFEFLFIFRLPLLSKILEKSFIDIFFRIPYFSQNTRFNGEHYLQMGRKGYLIGKVRKILKKRFKIIKEVRCLLKSYYHFFVLRKIN